MKRCSLCNVEKPLSCFGSDKRRNDGLKARCRACYTAVARHRYQEEEEYRQRILANSRKYKRSARGKETVLAYSRTDKAKAYRASYRKSPRGKEAQRRSSARKYAKLRRDPKAKAQLAARRAVKYAVDTGKLPHISTQSCQDCNATAVHYHHHLGYERTRRLDVLPLCDSCHKHRHSS